MIQTLAAAGKSGFKPSDWIAIGAVIVSGLALIFGYLTAKVSVKGQRDIATDERLWQRRADVYVNLLDWCDARDPGGPVER